LAAAALEQALTLVSSEMSQPTQAQNSLQQCGTTLPSHEEVSLLIILAVAPRTDAVVSIKRSRSAINQQQ
jgi:hypothetical protein